jgi:hypothetical protein
MPSYIATAMLQRTDLTWHAFPLRCHFTADSGGTARYRSESFFQWRSSNNETL